MNQKIHILIAGGNGLIGTRLTELLLAEDYLVSFLSRDGKSKNGIPTFQWNPTIQSIDSSALKGITHIVNLAGEPIAGARWSKDFKDKILQSRLNASATLLQAIQSQPNAIQAIISASAIGIYGDRNQEVVFEESKYGKDFLADTVLKWESSYDQFPIRKVLLRTGIVLSKNGGALVQLSNPIKFGIAPIPGSGKQIMSWIHIDDLCNIYIQAIKNESMNGIYNAVSPEPLDNRSFMLSLRKVINKLSIPIKIPAFILNIILGEQKAIVLDSVNASANKIIQSGFEFKFSNIDTALNDIYA